MNLNLKFVPDIVVYMKGYLKENQENRIFHSCEMIWGDEKFYLQIGKWLQEQLYDKGNCIVFIQKGTLKYETIDITLPL